MLFAGKLLFTAMAVNISDVLTMGVKSVIGSYLWTAGLVIGAVEKGVATP